MTNKKILLYRDEGATELCVLQLEGTLKRFCPDYDVVGVKGKEVKNTAWEASTALFCMGGGFDRGYQRTLGPEGVKRVKGFIEAGGRFLGICAGAYFACDRVRFDEGGPFEVLEDRQINLFPGDAIGPVYPGYRPDSESGCCAPVIQAKATSEWPSSVACYFNGGCRFAQTRPGSVENLFTYADSGEPAVVSCRLGLGHGILSGVHFEFDPDMLAERERGPETLRILPTLQQAEEIRVSLCQAVFRSLLSFNL